MKILQLTSDWKWTGPAEPMLLLAAAQEAAGDQVFLGCPEAPDATGVGIAATARARAAENSSATRRQPNLRLAAARGIRPLRDTPDARSLRTFLDEHDIEIIHTWHSRDHALALRAAAKRRRAGRSLIVRSLQGSDAPAARPWNRWLFGGGADGVLCVSPRAAERTRSIRGGRAIAGALGCVDLDRFGDARTATPELRSRLGLAPDSRVVGVVARVQRHRRFDLLLAAMQRLAHSHPDVQLLVLGRGTHLDEVARLPAQRLGLSERVVFAGHQGELYAQALCALDLLTFLVPGSDGTCRAVLEAAACGVPTVASRRGALPEIVIDGETGLLVDEDPQALALSWARLLDDEKERDRLGAAARSRARQFFAPEQRARIVRELYEQARAQRCSGSP